MRLLQGAAADTFVNDCANRASRIPPEVEQTVRTIVERVHGEGDAALREYVERWDALPSGSSFRVSQAAMQAALSQVSPDFLAALRIAATNIRAFAERQLPREWTYASNGLTLTQLARPLESVGCYVPGGRYPLPSTLLMTVIPAQVAGVSRIVVTSPNPAPETLAAAALLGIEEFYAVGGAQAIAALAYGTASIPPVSKIVGPGNLYVTAAKKLVAFDCAIDMLAGPTEAVIVAEKGDASWIASDLVAQAEHDPEACSVFITSTPQLASAVLQQVGELSAGNHIASTSLGANGAVLLAASHAQALTWVNQIAPEHLTVAEADVPFITNAGSVFVGDASSQVFGDYVSGPNHVLPTAGAARFRGGLSTLDFVKLITVQSATPSAAARLAATAQILAQAEGLTGHARAAALRSEPQEPQAAAPESEAANALRA